MPGRAPIMEVILSAIMGDLAGRSVSFLLDRILNHRPEQLSGEDDDDETETLDRLRRLLLRVHVVVEEAEARRVTNGAMLRQLSLLREEMYRGCHALDGAVAGRRRRKGRGGDAEASRRRRRNSLVAAAASGFNPAKRVCLVGSRRPPLLQLQQVLGSLEAVFADVKDEFVALLAGCPPRLGRRHQPYSAYMFIDKCMFGRQMEVERVVAFLLQEEEEDDHVVGAPTIRPGVLPISGPKRGGKSTLVDHACNDERVRGHFSQIVSLSRGNLGDENSAAPTTTTTLTASSSCCEERVLLIVELDGDRNTKGLDWAVTEALLRRFLSACKSRRVSKIIVTSRSDKVARFGTTGLLRLRPLPEEAFWYFFKARAFGSADAAEHPGMVSVAMDMAEEMRGSFAAANFFGGLLRSNFDAGFWSLALAVFRRLMQTKLVVVHDRAQQTGTGTGTETWEEEEVTEPACTSANEEEADEQFVFFDDFQIGPFAVDGVPEVSLRDVLFGGARPQGKFDVLAWKSPVPPHYSYAYTCEIQSLRSPGKTD